MHNLRVSLCVPRVSLCVAACASLLLAACAGGSSGTGAAGNSGGGTTGSAGTTGAAGAVGTAGTTGTAGQGNPGTAGTGVAGNIAGSGGATGSAGNAGTAGSAGTTGAGGTSGAAGGGTAGSGGSGGATGSAGTTGGRGGSGGGTAGTGGRGGTTGSAGSAGGGTAGAQGTAGANGQCPTGAIFCADFESGTIPTQAVYYPDYQRSMSSMYMTVDSTIAHGGTHSLKVTPGGNFSQMLGVMTGTPTFWTRVYLRYDIDTVTVSGHDTFVLATDGNGDPNAGQHVRIGEHSCQLEINRKSDDKEILSDAVNGTSMYMCSGGIAPVKNTWYCLEVFYDGPRSEVRVFVNGTESAALHVTDWGPYTYDMFKFGFENYGGTSRTLWYDDVAIATQRIGCQ